MDGDISDADHGHVAHPSQLGRGGNLEGVIGRDLLGGPHLAVADGHHHLHGGADGLGDVPHLLKKLISPRRAAASDLSGVMICQRVGEL